MTSTSTGRLNSANSSRAVKAPVRSVCTTNITASGLSAITTIDGSLTPAADDRFLLAGQTDSVDNGIYVASSGTWTRSTDFDANRDVCKGTRITTEGGLTYRLTSSNPIVIGTTALTFASNDSSDIVTSLASTAVGAGAALVGINDAGSLYTGTTVEAALQEAVTLANTQTVTGNKTLSGTNTHSGSSTFSGAVDMTSTVSRHGTAAYMLKGVTTYTTGAGTYTVPTGVRALRVRMVGGGGGGGYARAITTTDAQAFGGGGAGGGYVEALMTGLSASYSYSVGAGGTGGVGATSTAATVGADTTFGSFTAKGGGNGLSVEKAVAGSAVGTAGTDQTKPTNTGATVNANGRFAPAAICTNPYAAAGQGAYISSPGGSSHLSGDVGGYSIAANGTGTNGLPGDSYGGGGGGALAWRNAGDLTPDGGAGAAGVIIIEEFY